MMKIHIKVFPISIKVFILILIALLYLGRAFNQIKPYPSGDGVEYVMMTEALYNHHTPEIKSEDVVSFQKAINKKKKWIEAGYKTDEFNALRYGLDVNKKIPIKKNCGGVYPDPSGKYYGFHFFFYSMVNVPGRWIADLVHGNPLRTFQVTNAFLVVITCCFLLFFSPFNLWFSIFTAIIFAFSTPYWYLGWAHPEILTTCLVSMACWFFFQKKQFTGIFFMAFASLQNQPLVVMLVFMGLYILYTQGIKQKVLMKLGIAAIIACWPPLFYYLHFHSMNLIKDAGFLKTEVITSLRVFGFYFDLNQGMILAAPIILPLYLILILKKSVEQIKKEIPFTPDILLPLFLIVMTCISSSMINWNHGQAVINRYATYFCAIIIVHAIFLLNDLKNNTLKHVLFHYLLISQMASILYHEKFNYRDYLSNEHKPIAAYILDRYPYLYSPDPHIFTKRTLGAFSDEMKESPIIYATRDNWITKILVQKTKMDSLENFGFTKKEIQDLKNKITFYNGWGYMNQGEYNLNKRPNYYQQIKKRRKRVILQSTIDLIKSTPEWLHLEEKKAQEGNLPLDEYILIDAEYLYNDAHKSNPL